VTRDYRLLIDDEGGLPLLSIYGGKITTYRRLAEHALAKLARWFPHMGPDWTGKQALPGGDIGSNPLEYGRELAKRYPQIPLEIVIALATRHGSLAQRVLGEARTESDLGAHFGETLYAREVDYFVAREWAATADDILWRRTKAGLSMDDNSQLALTRYIAQRATAQPSRSSQTRGDVRESR
jgi:glycerol-3-phosphate dehydrogenase